ncbi:signal peptide peptidase SppA [Govanella unica]|uniref:Signal peptide peptidase SppA n=1 Tax=Govanella unica TaxID=2975056 RepID=A0A9X3TZ06_9PROT|nr:signal peptide peptidase SppA [Govania unica]MDA5194586.1 signal peptide peptidase SppA [Govania unica]
MSTDLDALIDRRRLKKKVRFWRILAVLALAALVIFWMNRTGFNVTPYVARISIDGIIAEDSKLEETLKNVAEDTNAKALIVRINSPGGTTAGSEALFHAIRRVADKKPVVATMGTLAASGGYVTAIAADRIYARETTLTGSIGVIFEYAQFGKLFEKIGVDMESIKSAPLKGEPSMTKPLTPEGRQAIESLINDSYDWFVGLVATRRQMTPEEAKSLADGRVFTGRQAVKNKLVDAIGGELEARAWLASDKKISADLPAVDVDSSAQDRLLQEFISQSIGKVLSSERLTLDGLSSVWHPRG